ncbi:MAG: hypothetical protein EBY07_00685 [Actinobacteria bacterium]|nr:hypothetical protein [Actinomycetota bacterium]
MERPLILLDVDGVINDIEGVGLRTEAWETHAFQSHGYTLLVPDYMPTLIRTLCAIGEVRWCTTWRHRANDEIATFLGIDRLEVIDDGSESRFVDWKAGAAHNVAQEALNAGRRVLWIEDFWGQLPTDEMPPGVEYLDTTDGWDGALLMPHMLPNWVWALAGTSGLSRWSPRSHRCGPIGDRRFRGCVTDVDRRHFVRRRGVGWLRVGARPTS